MAATYDTALGDNVSIVRFRVGDTDTDKPFLDDGEITYLLNNTSSVDQAALEACRAIVAKLAREVNVSTAGVNSQKTSKFQQYKELLKELEHKSGMAATPHVGGLSKDRADTADDDDDFRPQVFGIGMHDHDSDWEDPIKNGSC